MTYQSKFDIWRFKKLGRLGQSSSSIVSALDSGLSIDEPRRKRAKRIRDGVFSDGQ